MLAALEESSEAQRQLVQRILGSELLAEPRLRDRKRAVARPSPYRIVRHLHERKMQTNRVSDRALINVRVALFHVIAKVVECARLFVEELPRVSDDAIDIELAAAIAEHRAKSCAQHRLQRRTKLQVIAP